MCSFNCSLLANNADSFSYCFRCVASPFNFQLMLFPVLSVFLLRCVGTRFVVILVVLLLDSGVSPDKGDELCHGFVWFL